jgi:Fic family protein
MIYTTPGLDAPDLAVLELIAGQRERLKLYMQNAPKRWHGSLRRTTMARAIQGSNSIEGYEATLDEAVAAVEDEPPLDERTETWLAIRGYRNALTYICQAATDPYFEFSKQFLKSLHFMMLSHDMSKYPGQWRRGPIYVVRAQDGETVYEAPDIEQVNSLITALVKYLKSDSNQSSLIKGAMAHLNLTMIHPFKDGNGRMARALQTLVIALDGMLHPVFSSIEEWLGVGQNTDEYYRVLSETGQGIWNPQRSAHNWIRFCLKAHYQQAATLIMRNEEYANIFEKVTQLLQSKRVDERAAVPLFDAALGLRITNIRYRSEAEVSELVASRDLKRLCDEGLLIPIGERRGRYYRAAKDIADIRLSTRIRRRLENPYDLIHLAFTNQAEPPRLPGL